MSEKLAIWDCAGELELTYCAISAGEIQGADSQKCNYKPEVSDIDSACMCKEEVQREMVRPSLTLATDIGGPQELCR